MSGLDLDAMEAGFRNLSAYESATRDDGLTLVAEVRRLRRRLKSKFCGCGWCCSTVPPGMAGEAHLRTCAAQKVTQ